jgi:hypothetical protein
MSALQELQEQFMQDLALLVQQAKTMGYAVTGGELWRTPQQVQWDVQHGTGISHSLHPDRLAIDLDVFKDGVWITDGSKLADLGAWWKTLSPMHFWGGDFKSRPDGNHFSISPDGGITK